VRLTSFGHATFRCDTPHGHVVLIDPWTFGNPLCPAHLRDVPAADLILITHAHHDHLGDVFRIAPATGARVLTVVELGKWLGSRGLRNVGTMNVGGVLRPLDDLEVTMTAAAHSSSVDDEPTAYVGVAAGYVLAFSDGARIYHAGDTAAFGGMQLIGQIHAPHLALLPMGDHHTMGPREAAFAARLLGSRQVVPMHYGIAAESRTAPAAFRAALDELGVEQVEVLEQQPGESLDWDADALEFRRTCP
jgi:L-ascorbate metabolism protein UlaG (beta-lactamase superfamily)